MFTGIVEKKGKIISVTGRKKRELVIQAPGFFKDVEIGKSIAIDGVCLTAIKKSSYEATFEVAEETLKRSIFGKRKKDDEVNLEKPMKVNGRFDGHIVQGHVDGVATVISVKKEKKGDVLISFKLPKKLLRYIVEKGSITVNGVSLTVVKKTSAGFSVMLIEHTCEETNLGGLRKGDLVNIEVDILAKYIESLIRLKA